MLLSTARFFSQHDSSKIMCREQRDVYCGRIEPICLSQQDLWGTSLASLTSLAGGTSSAISASLSFARLTFRHTELIFWHPNDVSGSCHVVFWPRNSKPIFEIKVAQLWRLVKIVNFNPKHLKLWNRVFQTVYFKTMWKKISLHRHFKIK